MQGFAKSRLPLGCRYGSLSAGSSEHADPSEVRATHDRISRSTIVDLMFGNDRAANKCAILEFIDTCAQIS
jgi:hypothetical protein